MTHRDELFEKIRNLHGAALREFGEFVLPVEEPLAEIIPAGEVRAEDNLPEICKGTECGMRLEPLIEKPQNFEAVVLSLRHEHSTQAVDLK